MKSIKKIFIIVMAITLIAALAISVSAYQFGNNSQTKGGYTTYGYIYTITDSTVGADTVISSAISSGGFTSISVRIVGYSWSSTSTNGYKSISASASGNTNSFGSHEAASSVGSFSFNTPY